MTGFLWLHLSLILWRTFSWMTKLMPHWIFGKSRRRKCCYCQQVCHSQWIQVPSQGKFSRTMPGLAENSWVWSHFSTLYIKSYNDSQSEPKPIPPSKVPSGIFNFNISDAKNKKGSLQNHYWSENAHLKNKFLTYHKMQHYHECFQHYKISFKSLSHEDLRQGKTGWHERTNKSQGTADDWTWTSWLTLVYYHFTTEPGA